jgi:3-oxoacyl-[acyl-carrier protein] reductase
MFDFSGRTAIVTGGTKGIGKGICTDLVNAGCHVIALFSSDERAAEACKQDMDSKHFEIIKCDVSDYESVEQLFNTFDKNDISIDILVNNAGIRRDSVLAMMKPQDWQKVIDINLTGVYNMSKFAVMNMMKKRYGRIISITSPGREYGFEGQANYSASKAAIVAMSKSLSKEVAKRKITVNCVSPGFIDTELIGDLPEELVKSYKKMVPMKRFGKIEEVSPVVLFLASEKASYITGSVFDVDGGL